MQGLALPKNMNGYNRQAKGRKWASRPTSTPNPRTYKQTNSLKTCMVLAVRVARVFQLKTVADVNDCRGASPPFDERISSIKTYYIQHDITEWSITMIN